MSPALPLKKTPFQRSGQPSKSEKSASESLCFFTGHPRFIIIFFHSLICLRSKTLDITDGKFDLVPEKWLLSNWCSPKEKAF